MPFGERMRFAAFVDNQEHIESGWDKNLVIEKNEIVFIGQEMDEKQIISDLDNCLLSDEGLEKKSGNKAMTIIGLCKNSMKLIKVRNNDA